MAMPYDAKNKKRDALVKAGLMEPAPERVGGPQPVTSTRAKREQEQSQAE